MAEGGCDFCVDVESGEYGPEFHRKEIVKARKGHRCCECGDSIPKGAKYERFTGKWDHGVEVYKTCAACAEIRQKLFCAGWDFERMWDDVGEQLFPYLTTGCLAKLESAAAKEKLMTRWRAWKGLAA